MRRVGATFVRNEVVPGWQILDESVPIGKRYVVDLDRIVGMQMTDKPTGRTIPVECVWVVEPGPPGWLPLLALKVDTDS